MAGSAIRDSQGDETIESTEIDDFLFKAVAKEEAVERVLKAEGDALFADSASDSFDEEEALKERERREAAKKGKKKGPIKARRSKRPADLHHDFSSSESSDGDADDDEDWEFMESKEKKVKQDISAKKTIKVAKRNGAGGSAKLPAKRARPGADPWAAAILTSRANHEVGAYPGDRVAARQLQTAPYRSHQPQHMSQPQAQAQRWDTGRGDIAAGWGQQQGRQPPSYGGLQARGYAPNAFDGHAGGYGRDQGGYGGPSRGVYESRGVGGYGSVRNGGGMAYGDGGRGQDRQPQGGRGVDGRQQPYGGFVRETGPHGRQGPAQTPPARSPQVKEKAPVKIPNHPALAKTMKAITQAPSLSPATDPSTEEARKSFKKYCSDKIVKAVTKYNKEERLGKKDDFKNICRKLTHKVMEKEKANNYVITYQTEAKLTKLVDKYVAERFPAHPRVGRLAKK